MKLLYTIAGLISLTLGVIGAFLPLMPTTCFVILSAWCFSQSSPTLHTKLREHRWGGAILTQWEETRTIPKKAYWIAVGSILISSIYCLINLDAVMIKTLLLTMAALSILVLSHYKEQL